MTTAEANALLEKAVHELGEHFGSVIVLVSYPNEKNPGYSQIARRGSGDWFAQQGMLMEELQRTNHVSLSYEIATRAKEAREAEERGE
jgi:hypothetical protein